RQQEGRNLGGEQTTQLATPPSSRPRRPSRRLDGRHETQTVAGSGCRAIAPRGGTCASTPRLASRYARPSRGDDMGSLRLWSAEGEAMRAEDRRTGEAGSPLLQYVGGDRKTEGLSRDERVRQQRESMNYGDVTVPEAVEREIAGVRCRVIRPEGTPRAVYLHFHGGGMVAGSPDTMDIPNLQTARHHTVAVVSADYRKAPEHPWPAGPDDGVAVAAWLLEHGEAEFGTPRLLIGGESAGGYMTAIVALRVRDELGSIDRIGGCNLGVPIPNWGGRPSQRGPPPPGALGTPA